MASSDFGEGVANRPSTGQFVESIIHEHSAMWAKHARMHTSAPDSAYIFWPDAARRQAFERWLSTLTPFRLSLESLRLASADASFRRYLRVDAEDTSYVMMDAPPPMEDVRPFIHVAELIAQAGLNAPRVLATDVGRGFLLLTDLGSTPYLASLQNAVAHGSPDVVEQLFNDALNALVQWQLGVDASRLPAYDEILLRRELALFPEWCVATEYGVTWTAEEHQQWDSICNSLVTNALAQASVAVHRDYMPRNLMCSTPNPGILDFQDAVCGPITYDLASLLRDAFISWQEQQEIDWAVRYWENARRAGLPLSDDFAVFWRQVEWMGLQRHLKVLGIFCRLKHRDAKPAYCQDLPRFFAYVRRVATRYPSDFGSLSPMLDRLERSTAGR